MESFTDHYKKLQQALTMIKLLEQSKADIQNNRSKPQERLFSDLRASLKNRAIQ